MKEWIVKNILVEWEQPRYYFLIFIGLHTVWLHTCKKMLTVWCLSSQSHNFHSLEFLHNTSTISFAFLLLWGAWWEGGWDGRVGIPSVIHSATFIQEECAQITFCDFGRFLRSTHFWSPKNLLFLLWRVCEIFWTLCDGISSIKLDIFTPLLQTFEFQSGSSVKWNKPERCVFLLTTYPLEFKLSLCMVVRVWTWLLTEFVR